MTVKEAIEELSKLDPNMQIIFSTEDDTYDANFMVYEENYPQGYWDDKSYKRIPPFTKFVKVI